MSPLATLTRKEFEKSIEAFAIKASKVAPQDGWHLQTHPARKEAYMIRKKTFLLQRTASHNDAYTEKERCEDIKDIAALELPSYGNTDTVTAEYHVLYSSTYCVPVLYFNAYHADGSLLTRSELEQHVFSKMHVEALTKSSLIQQGAISQHEHPLLGHPFYYIHPCDTTALMTQLHITDANSYIASWISFFGPPVGMGIGSEYFI